MYHSTLGLRVGSGIRVSTLGLKKGQGLGVRLWVSVFGFRFSVFGVGVWGSGFGEKSTSQKCESVPRRARI